MENWLHTGTEMQILEEEYRKLTLAALPDAPMEDELYDLYAELILIDAHVIGLASSYLKRKKIDFNLLNTGSAFGMMVEKADVKSESLFKMIERKEQLDNLINMIKSIEKIS